MATRRPTISDVARSAGVSKGAVSFALNDRPGVAPETRDRILAAAAELGWTPSHRARALAASRALAVGLVIARPPETLGADPFFPSFIAGIESTLSPLGQALLLQVVPDRDRELDGYRKLAADGRVDGVFLTDLRVDDPRPDLLAELGLPAVWIGPSCTDESRPCVAVDDRPGIVAAVEPPGGPRSPASSPTSPGRTSSCTASPAGRPGPVRCTPPGLAEGPCVRVRLLGPGRRRRHQARCSTCPSRPPRSSTPTT